MKNFLFLFFLAISYLGISQDKNILRADFCQLEGGTILPRFSFEGIAGSSIFLPKNWGFYMLSEFSYTVAKNNWIEKGYNIDNEPDLSLNFGVNHRMVSQKFGSLYFAGGIGGSFWKSYLGPIVSFSIEKDKLTINGTALYATFVGYKSRYSEEYLEEYKKQNREPVYIRGRFDPNSWWKCSVSYTLDENLKVGIVSERFYLTGIFVKYKLSQKIQFEAIVGQNFIKKQFGLSLGIAGLNL